jgi:TetR/AcrR family transcriptional regulator
MKIVKSATEAFKKLKPEKQDRVFQAAVDEFAENGYSHSSMNVICKEAGVSKGSLFHYFTSKSGLFRGILETATGRVKKYLKDVRDETNDMDFFTRLEILIRSGFKFIDKHPNMARIYFHILLTNDAPSGSRLVANLNRKSRDFLQELISDGIRNGELKKDIDTDRVAYLLNVLLERLLRTYYTDFLAPDLDLYKADRKEIDQWIEATIEFTRNGLGKNA